MRARPARVLASTLACAVGGALVATAGAARAQERSPLPVEDQIVLSGSVTVPRGDAVGEVVVFTGRVTVHGVVEGDVVVFEGRWS